MMASTENWESISKVSANVKMPQWEAYQGSSKNLQISSDKNLKPNPRPVPHIDNLSLQRSHASNPEKNSSPKVVEKPFYGILEKKMSPVLPTFPCPKFPKVQSPVSVLPSPGISLSSEIIHPPQRLCNPESM
ncbi:hypothetical protein O181_018681 [Austropuccinia psidii MF-1]|uniref:Uncharacterized protein n=1 Tax=Austropuccinia psidii MF-1 TaxID=1389203 RepID=A0A9Q3C5S1_9BASI|nr:hypothetical protein [Austropuccinia psidii MF-1]